MKKQTLVAITKLINFDQSLLNDTLSKESLDREKVDLLKRSLKGFFEKERQVMANKFCDNQLTEILSGYLEEIDICFGIATKQGLAGKDKLKNIR